MRKLWNKVLAMVAMLVSAVSAMADTNDLDGLVTDVTGAVSSGKGYAVTILTGAVAILAVFIGWKLLKRAAGKV